MLCCVALRCVVLRCVVLHYVRTVVTRGYLDCCPTSKYLSRPSTAARACHNALGPGLAPRLSCPGPDPGLGGCDGCDG